MASPSATRSGCGDPWSTTATHRALQFPKASITLDGNVDLQGDMPAKLNLQFSDLDINPFLPAEIRSRVTQHASLNGQAQLTGPLQGARAASGSLSMHEFSVEMEHIALKSDGPIELSFANQVVTVQRCTLISEDTHFSLSGRPASKTIAGWTCTAAASLNLKLAETLDPELTSLRYLQHRSSRSTAQPPTPSVGTSRHRSRRAFDDRSARRAGRCQWDAGIQ